ncbi:MAG: DUF1015 family protein [Pseudomonadota bacterium]|nr:DUF1015 family protein [Pseudomonadota bacterium]
MALIVPFRALRPERRFAAGIAAPPYDVLDAEEAREIAGGNPWSFLHVEKSEIDLPDYPRVEEGLVFTTAARNLEKMRREHVLFQDPTPRLYIYAQEMAGRRQYGVVAGVSVREYEAGRIKKHEHTRADKERERIGHVDAVSAQTGPVFVAYRKREDIDAIVSRIVQGPPEYDFVASDGIAHQVWVIADPAEVERLTTAFEPVPALYIADGHHRASAAAAVARRRRERDPAPSPDRPYESFLAVLFPHDQLRIMAYNRVVRDLHGLDGRDFLARVVENFHIGADFTDRTPRRRGEFGMYLDGAWRRLVFREEPPASPDPVRSLDVSILQDRLLGPILGIGDPRTESRIDFIGGIRGMEELERLVDSRRFAVAFSLVPTTMEELMTVADAGLVMPPKSTWFEPKLRSGLFVHLI